jgi:pimeloyl-[acyl-carrier protein] methyl ester esterase
MALPLVALHGWGADARVWPEELKKSDGYQWHDVDLPGHSGAAGAATTCFAAALERIAAAAPSRCHVLGWSLGAQFALAWAQRHPRQVERLVLISATPRFVAGPDWPHGMPEATLRGFGAVLGREPDTAWQRFLMLQTQGDTQTKAVVRALRSALGARPPATPAVLRDALAWLRDNDLREACAAITRPCLVVHGSEDRIVPPAAGLWLAAQLPVARMHLAEGAAHAPFLSAPSAMRECIEDFLS